MGCRVIATTSSAAKADRLREMGVDEVVDYAQICLLWVVSPQPEILTVTEDDLNDSLATIRREFVGNRVELEALCQAVAANRIRPIVDRVFGFDDAVAAYRSYRDEDSFGKVVIEIPG